MNAPAAEQAAIRTAPAATPATWWASDAIATLLQSLDLDYIALSPGSSFRGLHDSLVNVPGIEKPKLVLCLHEEHAVAIAHGYYKASGRMMAAALHANVGLMHATMAIFNAWCDRVPVLLLGAGGPFDASQRRPWVDWLHTSTDLGALVRGYTKWDDRPASVAAALESLLRANQIATTDPQGPVYVCLDVTLQETRLPERMTSPDPQRFPKPVPGDPQATSIDLVAQLLAEAERPTILMGRVSPSREQWERRIALAERLAADVVTDLKVGARFPTGHPNHPCPPGLLINPAAAELVRKSDLIISLDWIDLGGTLQQVYGANATELPTIVHASLDQYIHNGWSMDYQILPPSHVNLLVDPDQLVERLLDVVSARPQRKPTARPQWTPPPAGRGPMGMEQFAAVVTAALADVNPCYARLPIGWPGALCRFDDPLDYLGYDGAGGIGSGPGMSVGAALALKDTGRMPVAVIGDGDFTMGATALWTAVNQRAPLLVIVANNNSFFNDELHQDRIARTRGRDASKRGVGIRMDDPPLDLALLARGQGAAGFGPVTSAAELTAAIAEAVRVVRDGGVAVVDVRVASEYARGIPETVVGAGGH